MPLESGKGQKHVSNNIGEMMKSYQQTGKIGNTHPQNRDHAMRIAAAAAYSEARRSGPKGRKG